MKSGSVEHTRESPASRQTVGSGARILEILKVVAEGTGSLALKDIASLTKLPSSSVHRLLQTLLDARMIQRAGHQRYTPGPEFMRLVTLLARPSDLLARAHPLLEELCATWHETCVLGVYSAARRRAVVADIVESPQPLRYVVEPRSAIPLAWGSLGPAILAHLSPEVVRAVLTESRVGPLSRQSLPARRPLLAELERIKRSGVATYVDPTLDIGGVAAPVFDAHGVVAGCIGVIMPAKRFAQHAEAELRAGVVACARRLSTDG